MQIDKNTKIGKILRHNPEALESIISINPIFNKLRNPVLRKLMANRTSIAMAAKVGSRVPADFFDVLRPLGFTSENGETFKEEIHKADTVPFDINSFKVIPMDVRPILAGGEDPLNQILAKIKKLNTGEVLKVINTFEPTPLVSLLAKRGYDSYVNKITNNYVETFFCKITDEAPEKVEPVDLKFDGWLEAIDRFKGKTESIDVRHLEMPLPMTTILESLEVLPENKALFVFHKKIPVFLLPELSERNFEFRVKEIGQDEFHLLIFRK
jgi:uncharacterized protein (DUF2249 family)